jgi:hypothetical protein
MVRESRTLWEHALSAWRSAPFYVRYALLVSALAIGAAVVLPAVLAPPAPSLARGDHVDAFQPGK